MVGRAVIVTKSPPHTRGRGGDSVSAAPPRRITPAYAGRRPGVLVAMGAVEDHPRMRGKDFLTCTAKDQQTRFSPLSSAAPAMDPCRGCRALTLRPGRIPRQPVRRQPPTLRSRRRLRRLTKPFHEHEDLAHLTGTHIHPEALPPARKACRRVSRPGHGPDHYPRL